MPIMRPFPFLTWGGALRMGSAQKVRTPVDAFVIYGLGDFVQKRATDALAPKFMLGGPRQGSGL